MIGIIKSDRRNDYIYNKLKDSILISDIKEVKNIDILILPFSGIDNFGYIKDTNFDLEEILKNSNIKTIFTGIKNDKLEDISQNYKIELITLMDNLEFVSKNAFLTAEGLIRIISNDLDDSLRNKKILLLGYGNVGICISKILNAYNSIDIYTISMDEKKNILQTNNKLITSLEDNSYDIVINTIPYPINKTIYNNALIYDISSYPYGFSNDLLKFVKILPSIPKNLLPIAQGKLIYEEIIKKINENN